MNQIDPEVNILNSITPHQPTSTEGGRRASRPSFVPGNVRRDQGSASYPQFVPGASEGELFGEVHTQYVESASKDNK